MDRKHLRERLEHLLREPNNLFGPPKGQGYDYVQAGITFASLVLAAVSGWGFLTRSMEPMGSSLLDWILFVLSAPFCIGVWFFWPFNLLVGWAGACLVWYATLRAAAGMRGWKPCGHLTLIAWTAVAGMGWIVGGIAGAMQF